MKCVDLPLKVRIITRIVGEFCANAFFHKFTFCGRRFRDTTKIVFNYGKGRKMKSK
jgi:hypothetical protein